jgi:hypothetical protein
MREHVPVETDKEYGFDGQSDEEMATEEILTKQTSKIAVAGGSAQR